MSCVLVVGAGFMGSGIAAVLAAGAGTSKVLLHDTNAEQLERGLRDARERLAWLAENGLAASPAPLEAVPDLATVDGKVDFVIEAVVERVDVKQAVFRNLARLFGEQCVALCTNTSSLDLDEIASGIEDAQLRTKFLATHFIGPAYLIPLVELCAPAATPAAVVDATRDFLQSCGKSPIVLKKAVPGFIAARLQAAITREAVALLEAGVASAEDVDKACYDGFGRRYTVLGPLVQADIAGLDVVSATHEALWPGLSAATTDASTKAHAEAGDLGRKSGKGNYEWSAAVEERFVAKRDAELLRRAKEGI